MGTTLTECLEFHQEFAGGEDYDFVLKALELLRAGNSADALKTLEELEEQMRINQELETLKTFRWLMENVILCREFPEKMRTEGWLIKVHEYRDKLAYYMTVQPKINREYLEQEWAECWADALDLAKTYRKTLITQHLTWEQVFDEEYGAITTTKTTENYGIK